MYGFADKCGQELRKLSLYDLIVLMKIYVVDHNQAGYCLSVSTTYTHNKLYISDYGWRETSKPGQERTNDEKKTIQKHANLIYSQGVTQEEGERMSAVIYYEIANKIMPQVFK